MLTLHNKKLEITNPKHGLSQNHKLLAFLFIRRFYTKIYIITFKQLYNYYYNILKKQQQQPVQLQTIADWGKCDRIL